MVAFDAPILLPLVKISRAKTIHSSGNLGRGAGGKEKGHGIPQSRGEDAETWGEGIGERRRDVKSLKYGGGMLKLGERCWGKGEGA